MSKTMKKNPAAASFSGGKKENQREKGNKVISFEAVVSGVQWWR